MMLNLEIRARRFKFYRMLIPFILFLVLSPLTNAKTANTDPFYFVQITDTHFGSPSSSERTSTIIDSINRLPYKIDFTVLSGDIFDKRIDDKNVDEALNILKTLNMPLHFIAGNHDLAGYDAAFYKEKIGKLNYNLEHKGYRLAFISSFHSEKNPMEEVVSQFKKQLSGNTLPLILFHHEPFINHCYDDAVLKTWEELLTRCHCVAIISGHLHRDGLNWFGGIPEYISSCVVKFEGRQASYRLYKCQNQRLSYTTFYIQVPYESLF